MKRLVVTLGLAAALIAPLIASAQTIPGQPGGGPPPPGPRSDMRAKFEAIRQQAQSSAFGALTPAHRSEVQSIVTQVTSGQLPPRDAAHQIDGLLNQNEQQAVVAAAQQSRDQMRAAMQSAGVNPPDGNRGANRPPQPGEFLLRISLTPQQMRALRHQGQNGPNGPNGPPPPPSH